jgi:hypothetical protein
MIDFFTCYLELRRNKHGSGASGFPVITLLLYGLLIFYSPLEGFYQKLLAFLVAVVVHTLLVFVIPSLPGMFSKH